MSKVEKRTILSYDKTLELGVTITIPEGKPKGIVQILHGMSEYRLRYFDFMNQLSNEGYIAIIHDHRGHGESILKPNDLGYFYEDGANQLVLDAKKVTDYIQNRFPNLPVILLGHSMGSLVARAYLKRYDDVLSGLILMGPPFQNPHLNMGIKMIRFLKLFRSSHSCSKLVHNLAFLNYNQKFKKESDTLSWLCQNSETRKKYRNDKQCNFIFTLNGFETLFLLMKDVFDPINWQLKQCHLPILILAGSDDPVIGSPNHFQHTVQFLKERGYQNIQVKCYEKLRHELLQEVEKEVVINDIVQFLVDRDYEN